MVNVLNICGGNPRDGNYQLCMWWASESFQLRWRWTCWNVADVAIRKATFCQCSSAGMCSSRTVTCWVGLLMTPKPNCCQIKKHQSWCAPRVPFMLMMFPGSKHIRFNSAMGYASLNLFNVIFGCTRRFDLPSKYASEHESKIVSVLNYSSKRSVSNKSHVFMSQHCHRASAKVAVASRQTVAHRYRHGMRKKKQRVGWNTFAVRTWHDLTKADGPVVRWICSGTLACLIWNRYISQKNRDDHEEPHLFWGYCLLHPKSATIPHQPVRCWGWFLWIKCVHTYYLLLSYYLL